MKKRSKLSSVMSRAKSAGITASDIFAAFCAAFVIASLSFALMSGDFTDLLYVRSSSVGVSIAVTVLAFAAITAVSVGLKCRKLIPWMLFSASFLYSLVLVLQNPGDLYFNIGVSFVMVLIIKYFIASGCADSHICVSENTCRITVAVMFILYVLAVFLTTAVKYKSFRLATFDFGIFAQMFEQMAKTGLPFTTVERSTYLSHFAVHFSPIFYLFLPGYYIFRSSLYLLFMQALVTGLGVFPVRKICKKLGLSDKVSLIFSAVYLLYPTIFNGCFCDFHENKILTVLLLWLVYFLLCEKYIGASVFAVLTLSVKEDAAVYVLFVMIWFAVRAKGRKAKLFGIFSALFSLLYFLFACEMIRLSGGEIMTSRFENFSVEGTLTGAVKTVFEDVGYLLKEVFSGADTEAFREVTYTGQKLEFVLWTCVPLMMLPFIKKRSADLLLLVPMLVINLMPDWMYQSDIGYQYTYGTAALLIFSAILTFSELSVTEKRKKFILLSALTLCTVFFFSVTVPKAADYSVRYLKNSEKYEESEAALSIIPEDASVTAYGYIMPHLWYIDDLHSCPDYYADLTETDYYVIDKRYEEDDHTEKMKDAMKDSYELVKESAYIKIYKLNTP